MAYTKSSPSVYSERIRRLTSAGVLPALAATIALVDPCGRVISEQDFRGCDEAAAEQVVMRKINPADLSALVSTREARTKPIPSIVERECAAIPYRSVLEVMVQAVFFSRPSGVFDPFQMRQLCFCSIDPVTDSRRCHQWFHMARFLL